MGGVARISMAKDLTKVRLKFDSFDLDKSGVIDARSCEWEGLHFRSTVRFGFSSGGGHSES